MRVVDVQRDRGLVTLTFDRPEKKNALNRQSWDELDEALTEIAANPEDRALMLTGAGGNFSSGADLSGDRSGGMTQPIVVEMRTWATSSCASTGCRSRRSPRSTAWRSAWGSGWRSAATSSSLPTGPG